jgi:DNA-binding MarR family transcriptional regulator
MQQTLRRLPHPEWIEEIADANDQRAVLLRLSRKGRAAWKKIRSVDYAFLVRLGARLDEEEVLSATGVLRQFRSGLGERADPLKGIRK